ncbi:tripartite tricarboxylate transporter substrate binding protein [Rhodopseudomonas sp. B29]|uniref:Bug family tripartite tricarboxylate transporter substrate binding protein n=1 Tax=Rhodopseudomonas sp. B29 TaxID=95607 RepID=UPI000347E7FE|nr:tripartite tricarboxylate transporter substrate-binding protein [Rhodopseudomonas sp. B29]
MSGPLLAAANYPIRSIRIIVPFAAGGPTDTITRIVAERMSLALGQQVIIENVVGAGGTTGTIRAMRSPADGYTLLLGHMGTHGAALAVYPNLAYDPAKDFTPISPISRIQTIVVARPDLPVTNLADLVARLHAAPETLKMAHGGVGSISFAACSLLVASGSEHRPTMKAYQGTGPAIEAVAAGQADFLCDQLVNAVPKVRSGAVRALAIAGPSRSPILPEVPTAVEAGYAAFNVAAWNGLFGPKNLPPDIAAVLARALDKALGDADVKRELADLGGEILAPRERTAAELKKIVDEEVARWKPLAPYATQR